MNICDLKRGERAVVLRVECEGEEHARLVSLGLFAGATIAVLKISPLRHTYLIQAGNNRFALGKEIAKGVRVWKM